jgi:hypothetical protein
MATGMSARPSWPSGPAPGYYPDDDGAQDQALQDQALPDQGPALAVISEMAGLLRDTRGNLLIGAGTLGAVTIGLALEAAFSARALRPGVIGVFNVVLLCGLLGCWLRAVLLLATAGRPVVNALSELRWRTGAPVDPRPRWLMLPPLGSDPEEWTWIRAHLLLGAARLARYRLQRADTWTYVTAAGFLVWTAVILLGL